MTPNFARMKAEQDRANRKHPAFPGEPFQALSILTEEFGELAQAINNFYFHGGGLEHIITEAHHVAVVALRIAENANRFRRQDNGGEVNNGV
jgi:NTP pyrophosphatase (non-canonical NTP hydrolase)